jgi:hypothetical protein
VRCAPDGQEAMRFRAVLFDLFGLDFLDLVCLRGAGMDLLIAGGRAIVTESSCKYVSNCAVVDVAPVEEHSRGMFGWCRGSGGMRCCGRNSF